MRPGKPPPQALMSQLDRVLDPCSIAMGRPMTIRQMGLIEELSLTDGTVRVVLCLTDPACINYAKISRYITDALMELDEVHAVEVSHTTDALWTPDRIRAPGRSTPDEVGYDD
jgi:metal-sulfur cluster biosynthetic enzyme